MRDADQFHVRKHHAGTFVTVIQQDLKASRGEDLVRLGVAVIVAATPPAVEAARQAAPHVPIVMVSTDDPVARGFVTSPAAPGGQVTGITTFAVEASARRVELLKRLVPALARVAVLWNPANPSAALDLHHTQAAARALGVEVAPVEARVDSDVRPALAAVEQVNAALNRDLAAVRDHQAQVARAAAQLDRMTAEATTAVGSARDYLTTRRGAVGASARARLAEAENQLSRASALGATDPVAALTAAQDAARLAGSALSLARSEVASFDSPARDLSFGSDGGDWGGAILGGILDGLLSGGGSSSSGWSSSRRRSSGSGGWGGSSRRSSGSSRRSSSSGGRRSRGGRF